jgi:hypothetical protein
MLPPVMRAVVSILLSTALLAPTVARGGGSAPGDDFLLPVDQHSSAKARQLATAHHAALRELSEAIYYCLPWLKVDKKSIGFFKPKGSTGDERYLSLLVYVEQGTAPTFARLSQQERATAMFSRYVGALLRRMAADQAVLGDPNLEGFTVILKWMKPAGQPATHETIAVFVKAPAVASYLAGRLPIAQLSTGAHVLGWDGETALGPLELKAWEDDFVATYKVANHDTQTDVTCR